MPACKKLFLANLWIGMALASVGCGHKYSLVAQPVFTSVLNKARYGLKEYGTDLQAYTAERDGENEPETVRAMRDRIVYGLMSEIDDAYGQYARRLFSGKADIAVAGDSVVLGLTAASTIATHTPTKTILSALGTAVTGVNLSVDKNFFAQQTFQAIAIAMQTRRDKARTLIMNNLQNKDDEDYPLEAVKRDLFAYFYAGTLPGGLQELQEEAAQAAREQVAHPQSVAH